MDNRNVIISHQSKDNHTFISKYKESVLQKIKSIEDNKKEPCSAEKLKWINKIKDKINNHDIIFLTQAMELNSTDDDPIVKVAFLQSVNYIFSFLELVLVTEAIREGRLELYLSSIAFCYFFDRYEKFVISCYDNNEPLPKCHEILTNKFFENSVFKIAKDEFESLKKINLESIFNFTDRIAGNIANVAYSNYRFFRDMAVGYVSPNTKTELSGLTRK